jgi:hypothetical protein
MTVWTPDGREEFVRQIPFIIRSCPKCHTERFAKRQDVQALDALRNWARGHPYVCSVTQGPIAKRVKESANARASAISSFAHSNLLTHGRERESVATKA